MFTGNYSYGGSLLPWVMENPNGLNLLRLCEDSMNLPIFEVSALIYWHWVLIHRDNKDLEAAHTCGAVLGF